MTIRVEFTLDFMSANDAIQEIINRIDTGGTTEDVYIEKYIWDTNGNKIGSYCYQIEKEE